MLQTMIYSIMDNYTPLEVNIYVIDCGNMAMKVFENSNHIGGIVLPAEEERISNLFACKRSSGENPLLIQGVSI